VLDYIDPTGELIHHRLFRESCVVTNGIYVKDLRIISNRSLKDMVIVDNAAYSFGYQLENGIPIISWYDDQHDRELSNLIDYMKELAGTEDVRPMNLATFHLDSFYEDYMNEFFSERKRSKYVMKKKRKA
jgi:CTD small phosphatase-like protein 2